MRAILALVVFILCNQHGDAACDTAAIPDLNGAWLCRSSWLLYPKLTSSDASKLLDGNPSTSAEITDSSVMVFRFPDFYALSKVALIGPMVNTTERLRLSAWDDTTDAVFDPESDLDSDNWIHVDSHQHFNLDRSKVVHERFGNLSKFWKIEIFRSSNNLSSLQDIEFFMKAGPQAQNNDYFIEVQMSDITSGLPSAYAAILGDAPIGDNGCATVTAVPSHIRTKYRLDYWYRQYTHVYGIPILASHQPQADALRRACYVVRFMMSDRADVRNHMYRNKGRVAIISQRETVPTVPEMRIFPTFTARAAGGTFQIPVNVGAEENMLCWASDPYSAKQDIFMHEFAHGVHLIAMYTADRTYDGRLQASLNAARQRRLWSNTYANTNNKEYFAEGMLMYWNQQRRGPRGGDGIQNDIDTREKLYNYDRGLYNLVAELFPCDNNYIARCDDRNQARGLAQNLQIDCSGRGGGGGGQCTDDNASCESWAEGGECEKNPKYMLVNCKKSCKQCTVKPVTVKPVTVKPVTVAPTSRCEDSNNNCQSWASRGECDKNPEWMGENCKKSCGTCPTTGGSCTDANENCDSWANQGYCDTNPDYMHQNCKQACNKCGTTVSTTVSPATTTTAPPPTTTPATERPITAVSCVDSNTYCESWANQGECDKNPDWMLKNCQKSCNSCKTVVVSSVKPPVSPGPASCSDKIDSCDTRVESGECESNRSYMLENCKQSCGECRPPLPPVTEPTTTAAATTRKACLNKDEGCRHWASYCSSNQYVLENCQKTCNSC